MTAILQVQEGEVSIMIETTTIVTEKVTGMSIQSHVLLDVTIIATRLKS